MKIFFSESARLFLVLNSCVWLLPNEEQHLFYKEILTDPATGIQIPVEKVFEDLM